MAIMLRQLPRALRPAGALRKLRLRPRRWPGSRPRHIELDLTPVRLAPDDDRTRARSAPPRVSGPNCVTSIAGYI